MKIILIICSLFAFESSGEVTMAQAQALADKASQGSPFPVAVNAPVLAQLNYYVGTAVGRNYMQKALARKKAFDPMLDHTVSRHQTPNELNALPILESAYVNAGLGLKRPGGLWMFMPGTARKYGLKVGKTVDERLNVAKATDAAHRLLLYHKQAFSDWGLAILAFNRGEGAVGKAIEKFKTRDAWELSMRMKGDQNYLSKVMAFIIIMKNPDILDR